MKQIAPFIKTKASGHLRSLLNDVMHHLVTDIESALTSLLNATVTIEDYSVITNDGSRNEKLNCDLWLLPINDERGSPIIYAAISTAACKALCALSFGADPTPDTSTVEQLTHFEQSFCRLLLNVPIRQFIRHLETRTHLASSQEGILTFREADQLYPKEFDPLLIVFKVSVKGATFETKLIANARAFELRPNPTHFSVALRYNREKDPAPVVVAKGKDIIAAKIRAVASDYSVPIIENKLLARALYKSVEIDQVIPATFYKAVAEAVLFVEKHTRKSLI